MGVLAPVSTYAGCLQSRFHEISSFSVKIGLIRGPQIFFFIRFLIFLLLRSPGKNLKSYDNPFWGKSNGGSNTNSTKRKNTKNSGHLRLCQQPRAAHALRSDQLVMFYITFMFYRCFVIYFVKDPCHQCCAYIQYKIWFLLS